MADVAVSGSFQATAGSPEFTNISLEGEGSPKKKLPKKILHFSDGILEEYSSDEEEEKPPPQLAVDPKALTWLPWIWYYVATVAAKTLGAADFCGEKLAWFFGITSPKYQHAIDEYYKLKEEEEKDKARLASQEQSTINIKIMEEVKGSEETKDAEKEVLEKY